MLRPGQIPERLDPLQEAAERRAGVVYLLTTGEDGGPHAVPVEVSWEKCRLRAAVSGRTEANIDRQPLVSFLWPAESPGGYTLFVDADAVVLMDNTVLARPLRGVLHRPGEAPEGSGSCGSDCVTLFPA